MEYKDIFQDRNNHSKYQVVPTVPPYSVILLVINIYSQFIFHFRKCLLVRTVQAIDYSSKQFIRK
jgi:hypothetical protein